MISNIEFVNRSLETHLYSARIMKEHLFFLQVTIPSKDSSLVRQAETLRAEAEGLLEEVIKLSAGVVRIEFIKSGQIVTQYTLRAENATSNYTGVKINTKITQAEVDLKGGNLTTVSPMLEKRVFAINLKAINLINRIIKFKVTIFTSVTSCKMFTSNYPLLLDHIIREARFYLRMIQRIQSKADVNIMAEQYQNETFWNNIMAEHAKFIRGLLDPSEDNLIKVANNFANEFDQLTKDARAAMDKTLPLENVTKESLEETKKIRDFKSQATEGILECKIKSIILPLLSDHVLREANHYLFVLSAYK